MGISSRRSYRVRRYSCRKLNDARGVWSLTYRSLRGYLRRSFVCGPCPWRPSASVQLHSSPYVRFSSQRTTAAPFFSRLERGIVRDGVFRRSEKAPASAASRGASFPLCFRAWTTGTRAAVNRKRDLNAPRQSRTAPTICNAGIMHHTHRDSMPPFLDSSQN